MIAFHSKSDSKSTQLKQANALNRTFVKLKLISLTLMVLLVALKNSFQHSQWIISPQHYFHGTGIEE